MRSIWLAALFGVIAAAPTAAQSNVEVNAGVQFDFQSPGARSLAMGGAFVGVADDATAAFVNPAGLRALSRLEVSFEARGRDFTIPVLSRGRLGRPSNLRFDTINGLVEVDQDQSAGGLSFLSVVYPRSRWAIAGYRHELANFNGTVQTEGAFFGDFDAIDASGNPLERRRLPIQGDIDLNITTYAVAGSFNVTPQLSIGGGLAFYDFKMDSRTNRFGVNAQSPSFYDPPNYAASNLRNYQLQEGDDTNLGINLGAMFAPSRKFQAGIVFRQGPDFDLRIANISGETNQPFTGFDRSGQFHVPHVFAIGGLYRPLANATIAVDIARVGYSRMTDDFIDIFNETGAANESGLYSIDDATELHAGFEYLITRRIPVALRAGYRSDPAHGLVYNGTGLAEQQAFSAREDDQHHVTFGAGVVFGRFEVNGGADLAERVNTLSVSGVVRF